MTATTVRFPGIPATATSVTARIRDKDTLAILETFALALSVDMFEGTVLGAFGGDYFVWEVLQSGTVVDRITRKIEDTAGPWTIADGLDEVTATVDTQPILDAIDAIEVTVDFTEVLQAIADLDNALAGIKLKTDNLPANLTTELNDIDSALLTIIQNTGYIPSNLTTKLNELRACVDAIKAKTDLIGAVTFIHDGGVPDSSGTIRIKKGDRHNFTWSSVEEDVLPDFTGATVRFGITDSNGNQLVELTTADRVSIVSPSGVQSLLVELYPDLTIAIPNTAAYYDLQIEYAVDDHRTLFSGQVTFVNDYSGRP